MKTKIYQGVHGGDWVRCCNCGEQMLLPTGAECCPECGAEGCLKWADSAMNEVEDIAWLPEIERTDRKLEPQDYLEVETLESEYPDIYNELMGRSIKHTDFHSVLSTIHRIEYDELFDALYAQDGSWEFGGYTDSFGEYIETDCPVVACSDNNYICSPFDAEIHKVWLDENDAMHFDATDNESGEHVNINWNDIMVGHLSYLTACIMPTKHKRSVSKNRQITITVRNGKATVTDGEI